MSELRINPADYWRAANMCPALFLRDMKGRYELGYICEIYDTTVWLDEDALGRWDEIERLLAGRPLP